MMTLKTRLAANKSYSNLHWIRFLFRQIIDLVWRLQVSDSYWFFMQELFFLLITTLSLLQTIIGEPIRFENIRTGLTLLSHFTHFCTLRQSRAGLLDSMKSIWVKVSFKLKIFSQWKCRSVQLVEIARTIIVEQARPRWNRAGWTKNRWQPMATLGASQPWPLSNQLLRNNLFWRKREGQKIQERELNDLQM